MNKVRLLKLAEVLENFEEERKNLVVPLDKFDMGEWFSHSAVDNDVHRCGTAACAVGVAMLHPWFRRRGLSAYNSSGHAVTDEPQEGEIFGFVPRTRDGFGDESTFFDIDQDAAAWLFVNYTNYARTTRRQVAARIRRFVATGKVPL